MSLPFLASRPLPPPYSPPEQYRATDYQPKFDHRRRLRFGPVASGWLHPSDQCRQSERTHQSARFVTGHRGGIAPGIAIRPPSARLSAGFFAPVRRILPDAADSGRFGVRGGFAATRPGAAGGASRSNSSSWASTTAGNPSTCSVAAALAPSVPLDGAQLTFLQGGQRQLLGAVPAGCGHEDGSGR